MLSLIETRHICLMWVFNSLLDMHSCTQLLRVTFKFVYASNSFFFLILIIQINDRYEFPLELDLDRDNGKYLSPDADRRVRNFYTLHRSEEEIFTIHFWTVFDCSVWIQVVAFYINLWVYISFNRHILFDSLHSSVGSVSNPYCNNYEIDLS